MTPSDSLRVKTDRAKQHIKDVDRAIASFLDSGPYTVFANHNRYAKQMEWSLTSMREVPLEISAIAGDAIQNLRSALDHMAHHLVLANGEIPGTSTYFPICKSFEEYASAKSRRKMKGMATDIVAAIDGLKPYPTGNDVLWRLHSLNNADKHRLLLSAASALVYHDILPSQRRELEDSFRGSYPDAIGIPDLKGISVKPASALFPLEVGKVFFTLPDSEMENNFKFRMGVSFNESGMAQGETVVETLNKFSSLVDKIIAIFDGRF